MFYERGTKKRCEYDGTMANKYYNKKNKQSTAHKVPDHKTKVLV